MLIKFCIQPPAIFSHSGGKFPSCSEIQYAMQFALQAHICGFKMAGRLSKCVSNTDLNYWIKLLSCIIEANGGHIGLSHINLHWYH